MQIIEVYIYSGWTFWNVYCLFFISLHIMMFLILKIHFFGWRDTASSQRQQGPSSEGAFAMQTSQARARASPPDLCYQEGDILLPWPSRPQAPGYEGPPLQPRSPEISQTAHSYLSTLRCRSIGTPGRSLPAPPQSCPSASWQPLVPFHVALHARPPVPGAWKHDQLCFPRLSCLTSCDCTWLSIT